MPLIKPRTRGKDLVRHFARLDRDNLETLYDYAEFLDESTDYVLNQVIDTVLAKDKEFLTWRAQRQGSRPLRTATPGSAATPLTSSRDERRPRATEGAVASSAVSRDEGSLKR